MKKQVLATALAASMSMPAMADFLGVYAGIDYNTNETRYNNHTDREDNLSGYVAFEHFIPLIPNVKIQYTDLDNHAFVNGESSVMNGILYYEILDNGLVEVDLGLAYTDAEGYRDDASFGQAYAAGKLHIPGVSMHAFADVTAGSLTSDDAINTEIGLAYTFNPDSLLLNVSVRGGYRYHQIDLRKSPRQETDSLFAGVELHF